MSRKEISRLCSAKKRSFDEIDSEDDGWIDSSEVKRNHLYLEGSITQENISDLLSEIDRVSYDIIKIKFQFDLEDIPIYLHINSEGGEVHQAFRVVDKIKRNPVKVVTIGDGFVGSAATFIMIAGHHRQSTPNTHFLIHQLSSGCQGKISDLKDSTKNCKRIQERIARYYTEWTKLDTKKVESMLRKEREFDAEKALEFGLVDELI